MPQRWLSWKEQQEFGTLTFKIKIMNKILISFVAICLANIVLAQRTTVEKINTSTKIDTTTAFRDALFKTDRVTWGLKAGLTQSNLYGREMDYIFTDTKTSALPSFHFGIIVNSQLGQFFWLKHELLLNQKGARVTIIDSINGDYLSNLKMLYLDFYPISPTFHFKGFQIYAGPYVSLLAKAHLKRKDNHGNYFHDTSIFGTAGNDESENKYVQKFDFGLNAGLEYQLPFGVLIGAKYTHGFTDLFQYANSYTLGDSKVDAIKIYSRTLMFSMGYLFDRKN